MEDKRLGGSFRDPTGYLFESDGVVRRRVNTVYQAHFDRLTDSGLYDYLTRESLLLRHRVLEKTESYLVIEPEQLDFVNFPYEWSFSQFREAALVTLKIQLAALDYGMSLKDASAFNVHLHKGRMVFIDTLSFECREELKPWVAYGQFCRHFLAPLLLMKHLAPDANKLFTNYLDGIPMDVAKNILPLKARISPTVFSNIVLHAAFEKKIGNSANVKAKSNSRLSDQALRRLLRNLQRYIETIQPKSVSTEWSSYYQIKNYDDAAFIAKEEQIVKWIRSSNIKSLWDIGGNNGHFTRAVAPYLDISICSDIDPKAIDSCYALIAQQDQDNIYPFVVDFTNPSPACGADNNERESFIARIKHKQIDCVFALAIIHHLTISNNQPFQMLAGQFARLGKFLIIEFVDREDSWVKKMLNDKMSSRDLYRFYNEENFVSEFQGHFDILEQYPIINSYRTLYFMQSRHRNWK